MNDVTKVTSAVYAELQNVSTRWAEVHDMFESADLDDSLMVLCGIKIRAAMDKVFAVAEMAKWANGYVRGTDEGTDRLMTELEALPSLLRKAIEIQAKKLT